MGNLRICNLLKEGCEQDIHDIEPRASGDDTDEQSNQHLLHSMVVEVDSKSLEILWITRHQFLTQAKQP